MHEDPHNDHRSSSSTVVKMMFLMSPTNKIHKNTNLYILELFGTPGLENPVFPVLNEVMTPTCHVYDPN